MLKITISIYDFKPWGQAVDTYEKIEESDKLDLLDSILDDMYSENGLSDVELNDILAYESDDVLEWVGLNPTANFKNHELDYDDIKSLTQQITLNSLYTSDYNNDFEIDANIVQDFYDGFIENIEDELDKPLDEILDTLTQDELYEKIDEYYNYYYDA